MKNTNFLLSVIGAACLAAGAAQADEFTLTYTTGEADYSQGAGTQVSATFDGTLNGNLITNIYDVTLAIDGSSAGSPIYASGMDFDTGDFADSAAVISLDGSQNDILFANSDYGAADYSGNSYFYSLNVNGNDLTEVSLDSPPYPFAVDESFYGESPLNNTYLITDVGPSASAPDGGASLVLFGLSLIGLTALGRKFRLVYGTS